MKRFIEGEHRNQSTLFPACVDDDIAEDIPVRAVDVFVDEFDIARPGFGRIEPKVTARPACNPSMLLKLYIYAYLDRVQSSPRIEREAQCNVELMWLSERLYPMLIWRGTATGNSYAPGKPDNQPGPGYINAA